jgi:hypothetical protein
MTDPTATPEEYLEYMKDLDPAYYPQEVLAARRSFFGAESGPKVEVQPAYGDREALVEALEELRYNFWDEHAERIRAEMDSLDFTGHEDLREQYDGLLGIWHTREVMQRARQDADKNFTIFLDHYGRIVTQSLPFNVYNKQIFLRDLKEDMLNIYREALKGVAEGDQWKAMSMVYSPNGAAARSRETLRHLKQAIFLLRRQYPALVALEPEWIEELERMKVRDLTWRERVDVHRFYLDCVLVFLFVTVPLLILLEGII